MKNFVSNNLCTIMLYPQSSVVMTWWSRVKRISGTCVGIRDGDCMTPRPRLPLPGDLAMTCIFLHRNIIHAIVLCGSILWKASRNARIREGQMLVYRMPTTPPARLLRDRISDYSFNECRKLWNPEILRYERDTASRKYAFECSLMRIFLENSDIKNITTPVYIRRCTELI